VSNLANIRSFDRDLVGIAKELNIDVGKVVIKLALDLHKKFSKRTPVDTGRARASWDIKEGGPSEFVPPEGTHSGPKPQDGSGLTGTTITFVTSAIHYMEYLNQGSSKQAPAQFIEIAIAEIQVEFDAIVAQVARS